MSSFQLDGCIFVQDFQSMFLISCKKTDVITNCSVMFTHCEGERHSGSFAEEPATSKQKNKMQYQTGIQADVGADWWGRHGRAVLYSREQTNNPT